ncbi:MAG TPA: choice-of-anchor tandem repeat GloVer-containing protein [Candidatus Solibacter sp.]|nr:choice-of-anchor tandem repeat GloVer-containing protein [Candidatus Solibacter sp.]
MKFNPWQLCLALVALSVLLSTAVWAQYSELTAHNFGAVANDALNPTTGLVEDSAGNLYGTAAQGGLGFGAAYELSPAHGGGYNETLIYLFAGGTDAAQPSGSLIIDASGNLYGVSQAGGANNRGTVYELSPSTGGWTEKILYSFQGNSDGQSPTGSVTFDKNGNLYGTTLQGGGSSNCFQGCGTVFIMTPTSTGWVEKPIVGFSGGSDGGAPSGNLLIDINLNVYGTTLEGGVVNSNCPVGCGLVFRLVPQLTYWRMSRLFTFQGGGSGSGPSGLAFDALGNLYGDTSLGGPICTVDVGCGVVYQLTPAVGQWKQRILHAFTGRLDGAQPAGVAFDSLGNLFGTTNYGNVGNNGIVWELTPTTSGPWTLTRIYSFGHGFSGARPDAGVIVDANGNLFGTTSAGGASGRGTAFTLTPP